MRKLLGGCLAVLMVLAISALSYAADPLETEKMITVTLEVSDVFGFQIWDTEYNQTLEPNGEPYEIVVDDVTVEIDPRLGNIHFYVTTNHGSDWYLWAASGGCVLETDSSVIVPLQITSFGGDELNGMTLEDDGGKEVLTAADPVLIYASGEGEEYSTGLEVTALFHVKEGYASGAGTYEGTIDLTMTE